MHIENELFYGAFAFFSTFAVYNGQRFFKAKNAYKSPWMVWVESNKKGVLLFVAVSFLGAAFSFWRIQKLGINTFILLFISGFISTFYVLKIRGKNMRELPFIKIHLIAFTWVVVLIVFPLLNEKFLGATFLIAFSHYAYVIAVTIPFDIRDLKHDAPSQKTIPQLIGIKGSKMLAIALLVCFFSTMVILFPKLLINPLFYIAVFAQITLIFFMNSQRGDFYCAGLIDGTIALLGVSYFY